MMAQMKCLSLILMIKASYKNIIYIGMMLCLTIILFGCQERNYPRHTSVFYMNDYAEALMEYTRQSVLLEAEALYENTKDLDQGGAQLVVATFLVENASEIASYDKTELYREWQIGTDDMGVLIILFFEPYVENDITYKSFLELQVEVGYNMEPYLTPTTLGRIADESFFNPNYLGDVNLGLMHMINDILEILYVDLYGFNSFTYDMAVFEEDLYTYTPTYYLDQDPLSFWLYIFSPYLLLGDGLGLIFTIGIFVLFGGGLGFFVRAKGKGGSSGGMGIFRRRR
ncbi:MAG: hypothetical protein CVV61_02885 [Tenericutes bacterium HGW-Tenericutes-6]|nr:MAG: hypothetical protein CVV61_02885 [Tenericutes bacterium HGW-Tenericutes-6]